MADPAPAPESPAPDYFFVRRPIVAIVISIVTVIGGLVAMGRLPIAQYPDIVPPEIQVQATYTGYYSHPQILEALGGVESDREGELRLERFDPEALKEVQQRTTNV